MPEFCTCGAQLPLDARFCHKCGKPQYDYPNIEPEPVQTPVLPPPLPASALAPEISFRNRTAVGIGFIVGVLAMLASALVSQLVPSAIVVIGGFFLEGMAAALAYSRLTGQQLSVRSGARMGWITGILSFALVVALSTAVLVVLSSDNGAIRKQFSQVPNGAEFLKLLNDPVQGAGVILFALLIWFVLLTTLTMLGGALAAKLSEKRA